MLENIPSTESSHNIYSNKNLKSLLKNQLDKITNNFYLYIVNKIEDNLKCLHNLKFQFMEKLTSNINNLKNIGKHVEHLIHSNYLYEFKNVYDYEDFVFSKYN